MRFLMLLTLSFCMTVPAWGQVVINEFSYDDSSTDDLEFVELYNAGNAAVDIGDWTLENIDAGGPNTGSPVVIPNGTMLAAGGFYVVGDTGVPNVDQVMASGWLQNSKESVVLRDASATIIDAVAYETNKTTALAPEFIEGTGIWGNYTMIEGNNMSLSRWHDGVDTDDNGADFGQLPWTPGASNALPDALPYSEDFDALTPETTVPGWQGSFVLPVAVDPATASTSVINPVGASPQGGNCLACWDPSGGGDCAMLTSDPATEMVFEAYVYFFAGHVSPDFEGWSIGLRGTTGTFYNLPTANGNTGLSWTYLTNENGGSLTLVDQGSGGNPITLGTIAVTQGSNDGWQRLRLEVKNCKVTGNFGGTYGDPASGTIISAATSTLHPGQLYLGYRESAPQSGTTNVRPLMIDAVQVSASQLPTNKLANPGFEAGSFAGWSPFGNASVEVANPPEIDPHTGSYLAKMFGNFSGPFNVTGIFQEFPAAPGDMFQIDAWSRYWSGDPLTGTGEPTGNWVVMKIAFFDGGGEIGAAEGTILDGTFAPDVWHDNAPVVGTAPAGTISVQALILFIQPGNDGGAAQIDDVDFRCITNDEFQKNSLECHHDWNGVEGDGASPAMVTANVNDVITACLTGSGVGWELVIQAAPCIPRSAQPPFSKTDTQVFNLDRLGQLFFWNGAFAGNIFSPVAVPFTGPFTFSFVKTGPGGGSAQMVMIDPTNPDGFCLSQCSELTVN